MPIIHNNLCVPRVCVSKLEGWAVYKYGVVLCSGEVCWWGIQVRSTRGRLIGEHVGHGARRRRRRWQRQTVLMGGMWWEGEGK